MNKPFKAKLHTCCDSKPVISVVVSPKSPIDSESIKFADPLSWPGVMGALPITGSPESSRRSSEDAMVMADLGYYFLILWIWFLRLLMIRRFGKKLQCFDFVSRFFGKTAQLHGERNSQPTPMNSTPEIF